jgi:DNA-binding phage protein
MDLPQTRSLLSSLSARAPRQAVETLIEYLASAHCAERAAVFVADEERIALYFGRSMAQGALDWTHDRWKWHSTKLARGFEIREGDQSLIPIMREKALVAVLYLEASAIHMETVLDVSVQLADAVLHSRTTVAQGAVDAYLEVTPEDEIQRQKIMLLLAKNEHNLSRVARLLNITRQALYRRMEVLGIARERALRGAR